MREALVALFLPAAVTAAAIAIALRTRLAERLADRPNERSLHEAPRPRIGGLAIMLGALPVAAWWGDEAIRTAVACAAALSIVSAADDVRSLPATVRLPAHFVAAVVVVGAVAGGAGWSAWVDAGVVLAIAWMTNLFNFMDGADGLAGGMAAIGFGALAWSAGSAAPTLALACMALASASLAFLAFNFPPARVFLGDAGSIPLGFLAGAFGLEGAVAGVWPPWLPVLVFSPFIVDATLTLAGRAARGEPFWRAHRSHAYQRLVLAGWSHRRLALHGYALMLAAAASALWAASGGVMLRCGIIAAWTGAWVLLVLAIERHLRHVGSGLGASRGRSVD